MRTRDFLCLKTYRSSTKKQITIYLGYEDNTIVKIFKQNPFFQKFQRKLNNAGKMLNDNPTKKKVQIIQHLLVFWVIFETFIHTFRLELEKHFVFELV